MTGFCPHCEEERQIAVEIRGVDYHVRGDRIRVEVPIARCSVCRNEFEAPDSKVDPLEVAYAEYRKRHGLLQPSEIREFRHSLGLTQKELSTLLGWGAVTLTRYENGALQDGAHDSALRLAMQTESFLSLLERHPGVLPPTKESVLLSKLREQLGLQHRSFIHLFEDLLAQYDPDEYSGYRRFDIDKLFNSILFFCSRGEVFKTKLNKLLFYADFKHYKEYLLSVTGSRYAHLPFGPAPDNYAFIVAALTDIQGALATNEKAVGDYVGEVLTAVKPPDLTAFDSSELEILTLVQDRFAEKTARQLSDMSHQEEGFRNTQDGEIISYKFATKLNL